jgi:hypothetical protein
MAGSSLAQVAGPWSPEGIASIGAIFCVLLPVLTIYLYERRLRHVSELEAARRVDWIGLDFIR